MPLFMRVKYSLNNDSGKLFRHYCEMREVYGEKICPDPVNTEYELHNGFNLTVDDVESAKKLAFGDELCEYFVVFEAESPTNVKRKVLDAARIGEIIPFSRMHVSSEIRREFLKMACCDTHAFFPRGNKVHDYWGPHHKSDKIYNPAGKQLWPVSGEELQKEAALIKTVQEDAAARPVSCEAGCNGPNGYPSPGRS